MAIKAGDLLHVGNTVLVHRLQTAGPGTINIPIERIYELGNYETVGQSRDIPDLTFPMESLDVSIAPEELITGGRYAGRSVTDGAITAADTTLTSATAAFTSADVGRGVTVAGAGAAGADLVAEIASVTNGTTVELNVAAGTTVTGAAVDVSQIRFDLANAVPIDVAGQFKKGRTADSPFDIIASVAVPHLTVESVQYRFGLKESARQTVNLRGDGIYYCLGSTFIEEAAGTGVANQAVVLAHPAMLYNGDTVNGPRRTLSVSLASGTRLFYGADYTEATVGSVTTVTVLAAVPTTDTVRVVYQSNSVVANYPQASHVPASVVKPAAIRGRDIKVYVGGTDITDQWASVQSVTLEYRVNLDRDEEFGNPQVVSQDYDQPTVTGSIDIKPRNATEMITRLAQIANVPTSEVIGALSSVPLPVAIALHAPADVSTTGEVLKTLYVKDARFTLSGYAGRVQQKLTMTMPFESDAGSLVAYDGAKP